MEENKTNQEAKEEELKNALSILDTNLRFYNQGRKVPADALKKIQAGRLKGMSDINPMWRMKRLTEIFGPVGFGWKYTIDRQWAEAYGQEVKVFCNISLYVRDPETKEWSDAIPGVGGSAVVSAEKNGPYVNDEAYKMALTDALSIAMKPLGIGGDIWYGEKATGHNESKYEQYTRTENGQYSQQNGGTSAVAFTEAQLQQALSELNVVTSESAFQELWGKWAKEAPALCMNGTEFYNAACTKIQQIKNSGCKMILFKQSPVIFDEDAHRYRLGEKRLLGITGLIHSILGLGVYPEADAYVKDFIIPKAGSRGTAIHHAIQTYDQLGIRQTIQTVNTRQGDHYEMMEWDVSQELDNYIRHLNGFEAVANELTVSDNDKYASQIDNVWRRIDTNGIWLVDTKSNNIDLYPLCGYFCANRFNSGVEALQEYLSWQLSIYAELFEAENPGFKVEGLACNWLRKDKAAFWVIQRKPSKLVKELLTTEYILMDNGPVYFHHNPSVFGIGVNLPATIENPQTPIVPQDVVSYVADLLALEKETKTKLDEAKKALRIAMEQHGIKSWDSGQFKATIAADSERATFDSVRFKKDHPDLYEQYTTRKTTKGGFTLK